MHIVLFWCNTNEWLIKLQYLCVDCEEQALWAAAACNSSVCEVTVVLSAIVPAAATYNSLR